MTIGGILLCGFAAIAFPQKMTSIRSISELGAKELQISFNMLAEYPDVCQDSNGNLWIAYSELNEQLERIVLKKITNFAVVDSFIVNQSDGFEAFPRISCDSQNRVWITWCAKRDGNWDIYARNISAGKFSGEIQVTKDLAVDMHPVIATSQGGDIWIVWECLRNGNFDINAVRIVENRPMKPVLLSKAPEADLRPAVVSSGTMDLIVVWDRQIDDGYRVMMNCLTKQGWSGEISVSSPESFNFAPSVASDHKGNLSVAWQTKLKPDGLPDYNHWLLLRQFKQGKPGQFIIIEEPEDRQKTGEDQGLEFPTMVYDHADRLWLFSRASQDFYVQCLWKGRKSPLYHFDIVGWGGRGVNIRAIAGTDGKIYSVRRDLKYIYLNWFDPGNSNLTYENDWQAVSEYPVRKNEARFEPVSEKTDKLAPLLPEDYHFYFGDIHQHSALSDGMGTVDECFTRSAAVFHEDFAALTDHEWFTGNFLLPSEWEWIKIICQQVTRPGEFTAIPAYEWTTARLPGGFGHKNIYFSSFDAPVFSCNFEAHTSADLFKLLKPFGAIAVPHHVGWTGTDWASFDSGFQPVTEIVSTHGVFEYMGNEPIMHRGGQPGYFIQDGLKQGLKFGLVGGSDGHGLKWHHGVGYKESEFNSGLTVVIARENTLPAIMEALRNRRVYATSGSRIYIDFRINGEWMGSDLTSTRKPEIVFKIKGSALLHSVTLIRDGEPILILGKDTNFGLGVNRTFTDDGLVNGQHFYYLRILQEDGEMAWSSPIWVKLVQ